MWYIFLLGERHESSSTTLEGGHYNNAILEFFSMRRLVAVTKRLSRSSRYIFFFSSSRTRSFFPLFLSLFFSPSQLTSPTILPFETVRSYPTLLKFPSLSRSFFFLLKSAEILRNPTHTRGRASTCHRYSNVLLSQIQNTLKDTFIFS